MNAGQLFIITAPSGTGKTTLIKRALAEINNLAVSISYTTRKKRPSEKNGKSYHFVSQEEFKEKVKVGAFAEYADVFGHLYGTAWQDLVDLRAKQVDVILELDYQGALSIQKLMPEVISIFILPPDFDTLKERLDKRNEDNKKSIKVRLDRACDEMRMAGEFDFIIFNENIDQAFDELRSIICAQRLKWSAMSAKKVQSFQNLTNHDRIAIYSNKED